MRFAFLIPPMMLLAACGQEKDAKDGTEVSINAEGDVYVTRYSSMPSRSR